MPVRTGGTRWKEPIAASGAKGHRFESCIARTLKGLESRGKSTGDSALTHSSPGRLLLICRFRLGVEHLGQ
jgi:hypothetical protein